MPASADRPPSSIASTPPMMSTPEPSSPGPGPSSRPTSQPKHEIRVAPMALTPRGQKLPHLHPIPFRDLPEQYVPSRKYRNPPVLHYGIPMYTESLDKYAIQCGRFRPEFLQPVTAIPVTLAGLAEIRKACGARVYFEVPIFPYSPEHHLVLALYANYELPEARMDEATEEAIFQKAKEALQLPKDLPAMWFHSVERRWEDTDINRLDIDEALQLTGGRRPEDDSDFEPLSDYSDSDSDSDSASDSD